VQRLPAIAPKSHGRLCRTQSQPTRTRCGRSRPATGSLFQASSTGPHLKTAAPAWSATPSPCKSWKTSPPAKNRPLRSTAIPRSTPSITALPLQTLPGLSKLDIGASSNNNFSGKGGTESANTFSGSITATVIEVLPNGHLVVAGEKQIGVNQNVDVLRFSGTIDPRLVQPGSIISSTQVANVRVESRGRGPQGEAQTVGWLSRFFLSFQPI
jgi:flagellar L-ring protein precursor FlgH